MQMENNENHESIRIQFEKMKIKKNHLISCDNHENHENSRIPCENYENHENY